MCQAARALYLQHKGMKRMPTHIPGGDWYFPMKGDHDLGMPLQ